MNMMNHAFAQLSPRLSPRPVPLAGRMISATPLFLFAALITQAWLRNGVLTWSVGIAYILYDTSLLLFTACAIWPLRKGQPPIVTLFASGPEPSRPTLGVIVAAHNEARVLGMTIEALSGQAEPPELILLADDGSSDDTPVVLKQLYGLETPAIGEMSGPAPGKPSLRWLRLAHGGKACALNAALLHADTEVVVTVDADTLIERGALKAMRRAFAVEPGLVAATGVLAPICGKTPMARLFQWFQSYEYVRNFLSRYAWMGQDGLLLISGAFAALRRTAVIEVGGFDPDCMVEDYELIHRLHRHAIDTGQHWTVRVIGAALAYTDAPASPIAFLRQRRRWFGGFLQTQHWNRDMVGNTHYGKLGTRMLVVKALDTLQPVYGMAAFLILMVLVATGRFFLALPILLIMVAKVFVDLTFHLWSLGIYKRWTGQCERLAIGPALLASFAEPFSFQLLRHAGAIWGWFAYLSGRERWVRNERTALGSSYLP